MNKEYILQKIRDYAEAHNGKSPGIKLFEKFSGIRINDWHGKYWARWSDALEEVGLAANSFRSSYDSKYVIDHYIDYVREIGHIPVIAEIKMKSRQDTSFPHHNTFDNHLGKQSTRAKFLKAHCEELEGHEDIITICENAIRSKPQEHYAEIIADESESGAVHGYVYLLKSGKFYKIGRTNQLDRRQYEIGLQLPEENQPIHSIETDDPSGIEAYWHNRFKETRMKGEWFTLSPSDVRAFRKRKFM
jgi:hypothetical protein